MKNNNEESLSLPMSHVCVLQSKVVLIAIRKVINSRFDINFDNRTETAEMIFKR